MQDDRIYGFGFDNQPCRCGGIRVFGYGRRFGLDKILSLQPDLREIGISSLKLDLREIEISSLKPDLREDREREGQRIMFLLPVPFS